MSLSEIGNRKHDDIDRGRAWLVMAFVFLGAVIISLSVYVHGVLYVAMLVRFSEGEAKTATISTICYGILFFAAPLGGILNNRVSCRMSIIIGACLSSIGFFSSAFVPSVNGLIGTLGVCSGLGMAFYSSGMVCVLGHYFQKYKNTVMSTYFLFNGLGLFIATPFCIHLYDNYGLPMTFSVLGCLQAQVVVVGALCKPSSVERRLQLDRIKEQEVTQELLGKTGLDWSVLFRLSYLLFLLSVISWTFANCAVAVHLPNFIHVTGGSDKTISYHMMTFAICNVVGRVIGTVLINRLKSKCLLFQTISLSMAGVLTTFFWSYAHMPGGTYIFATQAGLFTGLPNVLFAPLSLKFAGATKVSESYVFSFIFAGVGYSGAPVILGYLYGVTLSYTNSFILSGVMLCTGALCSFASLYLFNREEEQRSRNTELI